MPERLSRPRDRRSMRMVWKTLRIRHLGLAFFWACSMLTFRSSILLSGPMNTTGYQTLVVIISFVANMTTLFLVASRTERDHSFYDKLPASAFTVSIVTGLVLMTGSGMAGSAGLLTETMAVVPLVLGSVLAGVGYGYFWGSWAECLGRMHPLRTSFYLPVVLLLTALLF
ncbi:MAG: LuxR family transcriptional regulator, partial [Eggerthella lenta]